MFLFSCCGVPFGRRRIRHSSLFRRRRVADQMTSLMSAFESSEEAPMMVLPLTALKKHGKLPRSDAASGDLVLAGSRPGMKVVFISHRWLRPDRVVTRAHPDDDKGTKYALVLVGLQKLMAQEQWQESDVHVWIDFCGIHQFDPDLKMRGVRSLRAYVAKSDAVLVPAAKGFEFYGEGKVWAHYIREYGARAWCRVEAFTAVTVALMKGSSNAPLYAVRMESKPGAAGLGAVSDLVPVRYSFRRDHLPSGGDLYSDADRADIRQHEQAVEAVYFDVLIEVRCHRDLEEIDLSGQQLTADALGRLVVQLQRCTKCRQLNLYSCSLDDDALSQIAGVLATWDTKLVKLDVRGNECKPRTISRLSNACIVGGLRR